MADTGFAVPAAKRGRFTSAYDANLEIVDRPDGQFAEPPAFPSGAGGLVSTAADWHAFGRMLLDDGAGLLSPASVRQMTTNHLTRAQRDARRLFLEGQGWGYGGAVDAAGRYGWVGGTGTTAHVSPSTGTVAVLLTQVQMTGPTPTPLMREFWRYAPRPAD
jgi:CubicO group peptidase (beta-lactamase class C family)